MGIVAGLLAGCSEQGWLMGEKRAEMTMPLGVAEDPRTKPTKAEPAPSLNDLKPVISLPAEAPKQPPSTRWEEVIARFEQEDLLNPPPGNPVLFIGSSSARKWDLPKYFPAINAINRGFGGSEIADSLYFADRIVLPYRPRLIIFYAGDNDIARGKTPASVAADFLAFAKKIQGALPNTKILFVAIKPSPSRWKHWPRMKQANDRIAAFCAKSDQLIFIDTAEQMIGTDGKPRKEFFERDGLHLSHRGYLAWSTLVQPHLNKAGL